MLSVVCLITCRLWWVFTTLPYHLELLRFTLVSSQDVTLLLMPIGLKLETNQNSHNSDNTNTHTHTHTRLTALCLGLPRWAGTRKVKPIWILLEQETVSGSGIGWAICKSAPCSRQITTPTPQYSVFYRPDALPAAQPTVSKHWRQTCLTSTFRKYVVTCTVLVPFLIVLSLIKLANENNDDNNDRLTAFDPGQPG